MTGSYSGAPVPRQARKVRANGLLHHVLEWGPAVSDAHALQPPGRGADPSPEQPRIAAGTVFLLHGYMDVGSSWDMVAPTLAATGMRVLAPDLRGFGEAPRAAAGSYFYFSDYVADVAALAASLAPPDEGPLYLAGHSMGGVVATLFTGAFPERVTKLAVLEGLGPPDTAFEDAPTRMREFIEGSLKIRAQEGQTSRGIASLDEAAQRLALNHPQVDAAILRERAAELVRQREDGRFEWRFDPLHRARSPFPFYAGAFRAFASRVTCPVLFVDGGATGYHPHDEAERLAAFADLRAETIDGAGHMMHWTRPASVAQLLERFFAA